MLAQVGGRAVSGSALGPGGSTSRWRRIRRYVLDRDGWRCQAPRDDGTICGRYADTAGHIIARAHGGTDDPANLRAECRKCNFGDGAAIRRAACITVVMGPPCGGKTTHVAASATPRDVVVDYDQLCAALGARGPYDRPPGAARLALIARRAVVAAVIAAPPTAWRAWIIHSRPPPAQLRRYADAGADFIMVDPGRQTCMERARAERPAEWLDFIAEWYADPPSLPDDGTTERASRW